LPVSSPTWRIGRVDDPPEHPGAGRHGGPVADDAVPGRLVYDRDGSGADAQAKFKAGNIEGIAVNAETMALNAEHIPMLFPRAR
jgi:hypothetical protein